MERVCRQRRADEEFDDDGVGFRHWSARQIAAAERLGIWAEAVAENRKYEKVLVSRSRMWCISECTWLSPLSRPSRQTLPVLATQLSCTPTTIIALHILTTLHK